MFKKDASSTAGTNQLNGKRWSRGGAGKFITIYPLNTAQCGELLESLYQMLIGYTTQDLISFLIGATVIAAWFTIAMAASYRSADWTSAAGESR